MAQEFRGVISGQVTDSHGGVIPNATVTAVREGIPQPYTAQTSSAGNYSIPYVVPGVYIVTVEVPGFKKAVRTGITVDVSQKLNLDFDLEVGSVSETVTVLVAPELINTADASGGTVMDPEKVQNLPLNGRQAYMLLSLTPGVRFTTTVFGPNGNSGTRGWDVTNAYVFNGIGTRNYNQFTLNGAPITRQQNGTWQISPNVDGIQEFKVMTNTYDAQYGRVGGGSVNITMKAGTKSFHGTVFDYWRNSIFDANTYQANAVPEGQLVGKRKGLHNQHQFGGTIGGPIPLGKLKNKTFFFFSFEGWREVIPFPIGPISTPGADIRPRADGSVDFSNSGFVVYDPTTTRACTTADHCPSGTSFIRTPFFNNIIPANRISDTGKKILALFPQPNVAGTAAGGFNLEGNNFTNTGLEGRYTYNQPIVRIDHNFSARTRIYGLFSYQAGTEYRNTNGFSGPAEIGNDHTHRWPTDLVLDATHTFSSTLVGDLRVSAARFHQLFPDGALPAGLAKLSPSDLGLKMPAIPTSFGDFAPQMAVAGYPTIIANNYQSNSYDTTYDLGASLTQILGRHTFHYGGEYMRIERADLTAGRPNGQFSFGSGFTQWDPNNRGRAPGLKTGQTDGNAVASLLLGYPSSGFVDWNTQYYSRYPYYGFYLQDDFKVRRNLTLNMGLRWDDELAVKERFNRLNGGFCFTCVNPATSQINYSNPNAALLPNPLLGGITFVGVNGMPERPYKNYLTHWQPKFGLAWALNSKTVFRGGYGISYVFGIDLDTPQNGFSITTGYVSSLDSGNTPTNYFLTGNPFPNGVLQPPGSSLGLYTGVGNGISFDLPNRRIPKVQSWSVGIQRELPKRILLDVSYVGNKAVQLRAPYEFNSLTPAQVAQYGPAYLDQSVPNPFAGILPALSSLGNPSATTIRRYLLLLPFPQFNGSTFSNTEPNGYSTYNAMQLKAQKRLSGSGAAIRGLSFLLSFTWSKAIRADNYLNNGGNRDIQDPPQQLNKVIADYDRPWDLAFSGVWGLPIGKGGLIAKNAKGLLGGIINNWSLDWIFTDAGGTPVGIPNAIFNCPNHPSYKPAHQSFGEWIYNEDPTCYKSYPTWTPRVTPTRVSYLRNPWTPNLDASLQKQWAIREGKYLQYRFEVFNVSNTPRFGGPSTGGIGANGITSPPTFSNGAWSGFGTINFNQQNFPRQMQMSLKLIF